MSIITWDNANFLWNNNNFTWDDVVLIQKAAGEELFASSANAHFTKVAYPRG